jgi:hypothetical protein
LYLHRYLGMYLYRVHKLTYIQLTVNITSPFGLVFYLTNWKFTIIVYLHVYLYLSYEFPIITFNLQVSFCKLNCCFIS